MDIATLSVARTDEVIGIVCHNHLSAIYASGVELEDLKQTLWVKALETAKRWQPTRPGAASLYVFIQGALENATVDILRTTKPKSASTSKRVGSSTDETEEEEEFVDPKSEDVDTCARILVTLEKARRSLSPENQLLLSLILEGRKQTEIAEEFNCSQPYISSKLKALRKSLTWMKDEI